MITLFKDPFFNALDKVFDNVYNTNLSRQINIEKNDTGYRLQIAVPGLSKDDIKISLKENVLTISYEKPKDSSHVFVETFTKSYSIPEDVNDKDITGTVENGILEVNLPKSKKKGLERLISLN
jgi:HSP20 family protein